MARGVGSTRADLRLQDYRDIHDAPFDAICSIEMVEAVGRVLADLLPDRGALLKPGGKACIQSIVIDDGLWDRYIKLHRFHPAVHLPRRLPALPREFRRAAEAAGLRVVDEFAFGADYAEPCGAGAKIPGAKRQDPAAGFDERFVRIWEFYSPTAKPRSPCRTSTSCSTRWSNDIRHDA